MIEYVRGELTELTPAFVVLETGGVGYGLNISLNTYEALRGAKPAASGKTEARLYVYESIREDAHSLYGFFTRGERGLFLLLIGVQGVGAGTARVILSSFTPKELCGIISTNNERLLKSVKGIGLKTAQRVIVELRDKIVALGLQTELPAGGTMAVAPDSAVKDEAVAALTMLGFSPAPTNKVVASILAKEPDLHVEQVVKQALKQIK